MTLSDMTPRMRKLDLVVVRALVLALVLGGCCSTGIPSSPSDMVGGGAAVELNVRNFTANTGIYLNQAFLYLGQGHWTTPDMVKPGTVIGYSTSWQAIASADNPVNGTAGYVIFTFLESGQPLPHWQVDFDSVGTQTTAALTVDGGSSGNVVMVGPFTVTLMLHEDGSNSTLSVTVTG